MKASGVKMARFIAAMLSYFLLYSVFSWGQQPHEIPSNRVATVMVSQDFLNEQLTIHSKSQLLKDLRLELDASKSTMFLRGKIQVPVEELRAINLDPSLGVFRFQVSIKPDTTKKGHLILDFPLEETYFYPAVSKDPQHDRVIIPVQLLSLALASARGYLAALSGDFSGFDRRTKKLQTMMAGLNHLIKREKNKDVLADLKNQRAGVRLQLAAVPVERKQLQSLSKEVSHVLGFTGEKELNLNQELGARKNALIFKINLSQLVPYLDNAQLGEVRLVHDEKDGTGENFLAIDVNAHLAVDEPATLLMQPQPRAGMKIPPVLIVRLRQSLLESQAVVNAEHKSVGSNVRDLKLDMRDDGLHVSGRVKKFFFSVPFETTVDIVSAGPDVFEVRVRELEVAGLNFSFLTEFVFDELKNRLDKTLKGLCTFEYVGEEKDHSRAMRVTIDPKRLVPAFPDLHLVAVDVREREFLLKIGRLQKDPVAKN
jgi:hypothetical protein